MAGVSQVPRLRGIARGVREVFGNRPARLLGLLLALLLLPLLLDFLADRPTLFRADARSQIVSFTAEPDTPLQPKSLRFSSLAPCTPTNTPEEPSLCGAFGAEGRAGAAEVTLFDTTRVTIFADQSGGLVLDFRPDTTGCTHGVEIGMRALPDQDFDPFGEADEDLAVAEADCTPRRAILRVPEGQGAAEIVAVRASSVTIGQPIGPASPPDAPLLLSGEITLSASNLERDLRQMFTNTPHAFERFKQISSHSLGLGDAVRTMGEAGPVFLVLRLQNPVETDEQGGGFHASALTLGKELGVSNFGLPQQLLRTTWFDRLASDDLLGMWVTAMIILASLWLEAVFLHVAKRKRSDRPRNKRSR